MLERCFEAFRAHYVIHCQDHTCLYPGIASLLTALHAKGYLMAVVSIKLVPVKAPWFNGAKLLVAADCTAYAYANFHQELMRGHITVIGCPKLDEGDYTEKLTAILQENDIKELVIVRMEVPCCGGLERAATNALKASGKFIPWRVVTVAIDGHIID